MPRPLRRSTDRNEEAQIAPRRARSAAWRLAVARCCFKLCRLSPHPRCVFHRSAQETDNAIKLDVASPAERAARWVLLIELEWPGTPAPCPTGQIEPASATVDDSSVQLGMCTYASSSTFALTPPEEASRQK